jgi:VWFA-related protein
MLRRGIRIARLRRMRWTPVIAAAMAPFCAAGQQSSTARSQTGDDSVKFTVRSDLVFLPTRVQDKKGETIYGLKAEQFMVDDNGVRQPVEVDEEPTPTGLSLVVVVQCSLSAPSEFYKIKGLGAMIDAVVGAVPHEVAILAYGDGPYLLGDFSSSADAERLALSKLSPCGAYHAATIDAVYYAINMLRRQRTHNRRAIILIGETRDHGSRSKLHEVVTELGINDTVIYSIAFSPVRDALLSKPDADPARLPAPKDPDSGAAAESPPEPVYLDRKPRVSLPPQLMLAVNALRRNSSAELASLSGGEYFNFTTQKGFERILDRIANQIHNYYLLRFMPPTGPILVLHRLRVRVYGYPNAVIQTRKSYWSGIFEPAAR